MKISHGLTLAALSAALLLGNGCGLFLVGTGVVIGAGTVAYVQGELRTGDSVPFDRAWTATTLAVDELKLITINSQRDELGGHVLARNSADQKITIKLRRQSDKVTEFYIRVGPVGDELLSRQIYDRIKSHF